MRSVNIYARTSCHHSFRDYSVIFPYNSGCYQLNPYLPFGYKMIRPVNKRHKNVFNEIY